MKKKQKRFQLIVDLIKKNRVGSQAELSALLEENGVNVTQATLSRDLKALKVTKVANNEGLYMYIIPDSNDLQDSFLMSGQKSLTAQNKLGFLSIDFSGNMAVIKTRNGYATGLAYDIDMSHSPEILGTIAGADTVFAILREGVTREKALAFFSRFMPLEAKTY